MVDLWYPKGVTTPEQRLRYYAEQVRHRRGRLALLRDPAARVRRELGRAHARRLRLPREGVRPDDRPRGRRPVAAAELRDFEYEATDRGRVLRPVARTWSTPRFDVFLDAIEPLPDAGKLGGILMQFPPYFTANAGEDERRNLEYLEYAAAKLEGHRMLVEFRHPSWVERGSASSARCASWPTATSRTCPSTRRSSRRARTMPPLHALTSDWAYVRFHGRNRETYFKPHEDRGGPLRLPLLDRGARGVGAEDPRAGRGRRPRRS